MSNRHVFQTGRFDPVDFATSLAAPQTTLAQYSASHEPIKRIDSAEMKRAQRLTMVQQAVESLERRRAEKLAFSERRLAECELRLTNLETYQRNFHREFAGRVGNALGAACLQEYRAFVARLAEAVRQQAHQVVLTRAERNSQRQNWQNAAQRAYAVSRTLQRWQAEAQRPPLNQEPDECWQQLFQDGLHSRCL
jgi:flagellar FliJ protein